MASMPVFRAALQVSTGGVHIITIRRRGAAILRRLERLPASAWSQAVIDTPQRCHQRIRCLDETIRLRGYDGPIRQLAVTGLGRERATLFLANHFEETPRALVLRYAGRKRMEDATSAATTRFSAKPP
jgi:hypothetical protein